MAKNQVTLTFAGDSSSLDRTFARVGMGAKSMDDKINGTSANLSNKSKGWASNLGRFAGMAAVGLAGVGVAAVGMGISFAKAAEESQQVTRQTDAVLKSMGATAWTTAGQVADLSEKLSLQTGIDDELIQSGQNVLLTFGNVQNKVGQGNAIFDRATTAALDMSVALGQDMQGSVTQLGKALNDPISGITALTRVGIQFTDGQKDQIAAMVEAGDTLGAQKIILGEVERQFAGSAESQATASQKLSTAWGNLQEELGAKLLPVFNAVAGWLTNTGLPALESLSDWFQREGIPALQDFGGWLKENLLPAFSAVGSFIVGTVLPALLQLGQWFTEHQTVLAAVAIAIVTLLVPAFVSWAIAAGIAAVATLAAAAPFILLGAAIAAFAYLVITHWETIKSVTVTVFEAIRGAIAAAFNWVRTNWPLLLAILTGPIGLAVLVITRNWDKIKAGFSAVVSWISGGVSSIVGFITGLPGRISRAASGMFDGITDAFRSAINALIGLWNNFSISFGGYDIPGPGPNIPSFTIDTPNIPMLAQGGIVRHRPGGILARIGEGGRDEAVVPLTSRNTPAMGGAGVTVNVYVQGSIRSDRELVGIIRDAIDVGALT